MRAAEMFTALTMAVLSTAPAGAASHLRIGPKAFALNQCPNGAEAATKHTVRLLVPAVPGQRPVRVDGAGQAPKDEEDAWTAARSYKELDPSYAATPYDVSLASVPTDKGKFVRFVVLLNDPKIRFAKKGIISYTTETGSAVDWACSTKNPVSFSYRRRKDVLTFYVRREVDKLNEISLTFELVTGHIKLMSRSIGLDPKIKNDG